MIRQFLRRLSGGSHEVTALPGLNLIQADTFEVVRSSHRNPVQLDARDCHVTPPVGGKSRWVPVTVVDISAGGARIVCTEVVAVGETMRLSFKLPKGAGEWKGTARITWASPSGLLAGVAFNAPESRREREAAARLQQYLASEVSSQ